MGGPAASGAVGSELPDLVVLEIGVDKVPQGRPLGAERARERRCGVCVTGGGGRDGLGSGVMDAGPPCGGGVVAELTSKRARRRPSTFALVGATGKRSTECATAKASHGDIEDILPRGGQMDANGEVFGVLEEALAGRILAEAVGEGRARCRASPGLAVEWTASVPMR